jgi:hypothetical protein
LAWGGTWGCGDIGEFVEQVLQSGSSIVDGRLLVVGKGNGGGHALQVASRFEQLSLGGVLWGVELATGSLFPSGCGNHEGVRLNALNSD